MMTTTFWLVRKIEGNSFLLLMYMSEEQPVVALYEVGQKVKRIEQGRDIHNIGAIVLEFVEMNETIAYHIQYDEGGDGWWGQDSLEPWTIEDTKNLMGIA